MSRSSEASIPYWTLALTTLCFLLLPASAGAETSKLRRMPNRIPGSYIVIAADGDSAPDRAGALANIEAAVKERAGAVRNRWSNALTAAHVLMNLARPSRSSPWGRSSSEVTLGG